MRSRLLLNHLLIVAFLIPFAIILIITSCEGEEKIKMKDLVPTEIQGWKQQSKVEIYDRETIFDYINGAGEVYLSYDFQKLWVFRLVKSEKPNIVVEIFDMGLPEDAFGVFSHARESEEIGIGQGSEQRGGLLCFWKGNLFVCIFSEGQSSETKKAVLDLARKIEQRIKVTGEKPKLLACLPDEDLQQQSVRYFHLHTSLNYHYYLASENILNLNPRTEAVLGRYKLNQTYLLLVHYPDQNDADKAYSNFLNSYIPEAKDKGVAQIEKGKWVKAEKEGEFVIVVFDAPTEAYAQALIQAVRDKILKLSSEEVKNK
ncbi:MAG: hypothetical protein AMJ90_00115 [candidate division Zixibacteria bacterium SM23_73_2]|nr:MAG: hypothetical protein AMJ90_00115 [candidate division Zixibacteria bacterium SM23_73_2]